MFSLNISHFVRENFSDITWRQSQHSKYLPQDICRWISMHPNDPDKWEYTLRNEGQLIIEESDWIEYESFKSAYVCFKNLATSNKHKKKWEWRPIDLKINIKNKLFQLLSKLKIKHDLNVTHMQWFSMGMIYFIKVSEKLQLQFQIKFHMQRRRSEKLDVNFCNLCFPDATINQYMFILSDITIPSASIINISDSRTRSE